MVRREFPLRQDLVAEGAVCGTYFRVRSSREYFQFSASRRANSTSAPTRYPITEINCTSRRLWKCG